MPMRDVSTFELVLVGFGHVGRRFASLLAECREQLERDDHLTCRVVGVATGRHGLAIDLDGLDLGAATDLVASDGSLATLHDPDTGTPPADTQALIARLADFGQGRSRIVVETTTLDVASGEPALGHVRAAIASGAHVVTANKGPAAVAYAEISAAADAAGVRFLTESAVLDGIPILNLARETLPAVRIIGFRGVVNWTTNHILASMEQGGDADEALAAMQAEGFAEADASLDVEGWDAAAKTAVLVNVVMGGRTTPAAVERTGIGGLTGERVRDAVRRGKRVKLVASATRRGETITATVAPVELDATDPLAQLDGQSNAIVLATDLLGEIMITQRDGGLTQTAYGLLADVVMIRRALSPDRPASGTSPGRR
ncbi:MAG: hypothetical protein QGF21_02040 [Vicinamibacterales bacterium]|nr:homoserine dehydrogenase [Acidobacteriota bacterium]MDP7471094.1 hypothetical protein [Vicinamibacterales bacterium]MDP7670704.1 hypothetical protein [Vicinamibacterales bacterium]HJO39013.1 hypothetical protein [Vicinamibacterales bacterium]